ncbi:flagellar hook protein FlgE [Pigmentiphaga sp.]|uniref:flagellar hook protein FlgE n=1 Tax=Pigmentiphaga sp. TaxID=1977564 RepID=UPI00128C80E1|nr:flagellar hook protein FlgE [Pigmentiphaga sp.]MPS30385.1 flagellar hook protein FlgE [Alcaligenaceae bacterium SAGV5]MPS50376.1 flagellar hook protein FlgE [Alcaligenaceae bacterium SAGV3]MPT57482.1 flagellar hook protein FlgE [Alcaligenaceae bacterium]
MSFQQALSGLNAAGKNLDVIGNNVANANTVGFKAARAEFADVYASTVLGTYSNNIGIGTKLNSVTQLFTQGAISVTSNPFDVAISGEGFFRMDNAGSIVYSRNGQFHLDANGYVVNANGLRLTGYVADANGNINTAQPQPLKLTVSSIEARGTSEVTQGAVLDSRAEAIDRIAKPFNPDDSSTYTHATSIAVYDSLGNTHTLSTFYAKRGPGQWEVYTALNGKVTNTDADGDGSLDGAPLVFDASGKIDLAASHNGVFQVDVDAATLGTGATALSISYNMASTSQTGQAFSNELQRQDGYTSGRLTSFTIDENGILKANYSNQQSRAQGQITLVSFVNPQGLVSAGSNNFLETILSGGPRIGVPGSSNFGTVTSGALEDANVDLTGELVNMITAQRVYQANAQTIKTQDSLMQTLVNMR